MSKYFLKAKTRGENARRRPQSKKPKPEIRPRPLYIHLMYMKGEPLDGKIVNGDFFFFSANFWNGLDRILIVR